MNELAIFIERIEKNPNQEVELNKLCEGLSMTPNILQRIFPVIFNITLTDYIRKRRLTKAALELKQTDLSIIEIALKYNYSTPEAFSTAFKKHHGVTPTAVRKNAPFNFFKPIEVSLYYEGGDNLSIEIVTKSDFYVAGLSIDTTVNNTDIAMLWEQLNQADFIDELIQMSTGDSYGVCYDTKRNGYIKYVAGWCIKDPDIVKHLPVEVTRVESSTFAIIPCKGKFPESLHSSWNYMWNKFLPESGYSYAGTADLEYYPSEVTDSKVYHMEIWVPVAKTNKNSI